MERLHYIGHVLALAWPHFVTRKLEPHAGLTGAGVNDLNWVHVRHGNIALGAI
jgi:hypothetical protein